MHGCVSVSDGADYPAKTSFKRLHRFLRPPAYFLQFLQSIHPAVFEVDFSRGRVGFMGEVDTRGQKCWFGVGGVVGRVCGEWGGGGMRV